MPGYDYNASWFCTHDCPPGWPGWRWDQARGASLGRAYNYPHQSSVYLAMYARHGQSGRLGRGTAGHRRLIWRHLKAWGGPPHTWGEALLLRSHREAVALPPEAADVVIFRRVDQCRYLAARNYDGLATAQPPLWYLTRAYKTVVAMCYQASWYCHQGLMDGTSFRTTLLALRDEGMAAEAGPQGHESGRLGSGAAALWPPLGLLLGPHRKAGEAALGLTFSAA